MFNATYQVTKELTKILKAIRIFESQGIIEKGVFNTFGTHYVDTLNSGGLRVTMEAQVLKIGSISEVDKRLHKIGLDGTLNKLIYSNENVQGWLNLSTEISTNRNNIRLLFGISPDWNHYSKGLKMLVVDIWNKVKDKHAPLGKGPSTKRLLGAVECLRKI